MRDTILMAQVVNTNQIMRATAMDRGWRERDRQGKKQHFSEARDLCLKTMLALNSGELLSGWGEGSEIPFR